MWKLEITSEDIWRIFFMKKNRYLFGEEKLGEKRQEVKPPQKGKIN